MRPDDPTFLSLPQAEQLKAVLADDELYAATFLKIKTKTNEVVPFIYNEPQRTFAQSCKEELLRRGFIQRLVLKARQLGFSTQIQGRGFKRAATTHNFRMNVISHDIPASQNLLDMSQNFYNYLPQQFRPKTKYKTKGTLYFANRNAEGAHDLGLQSQITVAAAKNVNAGRGSTIHFAHFSEAAFWKDNGADPSKLITGFMQAVPMPPPIPPPGYVPTEVYIETTANGAEGFFYELWLDALKGRNNWTPYFVSWLRMETYRMKFTGRLRYTKEEERLRDVYHADDEQLAWRRWMIAVKLSGDEKLFKQEYPADWTEAFQSSGVGFFPSAPLQEMLQSMEAKPLQVTKGTWLFGDNKETAFDEDVDGDCVLRPGYDPKEQDGTPRKDGYFVIAADSSEGTEDEEHDPSGILVTFVPYDQTRLPVEVMEYNGFREPFDLAKLLIALGYYYNNAYLIWEHNNHGQIITSAVVDEGYEPCYEREVYDSKALETTMRAGFYTDGKSKPFILDLLKEALTASRLLPLTREAVLELLTFKKKRLKYTAGIISGTAEKGSHDERVIIRALTHLAIRQGGMVPDETPDERDYEKWYGTRDY